MPACGNIILCAPSADRGFSIFTPADGLSRGRGYSVYCPVCNGLHLDANGLVMSDLGDPKAPLRLNQAMMGGGYIHDFYCLYPQVEGEGSQNRKTRLVALAAQACADVALPEADRMWLIEQLYDRNPYVLHVAKNVLDEIARAPESRSVIQQIEHAENANKVLARFGINVARSAATVQNPNAAVAFNFDDLGGFSTPMTSDPDPSAAPSGPKHFCPNCGAPASGKFCGQCGAPME